MFTACVFLAVVIAATQAQHGTNLHGICHSNHQELNEDQVIEMVVRQMDLNHDDRIVEAEILTFFADLMGVNLQHALDLDVLLALNTTIILQMASGLDITKHDFTHNWHTKYHDSMDFIEATFEAFDAFDGAMEGRLDGADFQAILNHAMVNYDTNSDRVLQQAEMVAYLEHIYKNC